MVQIFLVGTGAGLVAALTFVALASASTLATVLFCLAPLPVMIAALGWPHWSGLIAAGTGAAALGGFLGWPALSVFLLGFALPAWWLGYLALLARPVETAEGPALDWYPVGRLVVWAAVLGAVAIALVLPTLGTDAEAVRETLKDGFERVFRLRAGTPDGQPIVIPGVPDPDLAFEILARAVPPAFASVITITLLFNLWLAGHVVKLSGRLARPWPVVSALAFPVPAAVVLVASIAGSFLPGFAGLVAGLFAASFWIAFTALGLAVLHTLTAPLKSRGMVLSVLYAGILLFGWPLVAVMMLGLADAVLDVRGRVARKRTLPPGSI